ncbi:MAG: tRNA lysidine(34) synthetase TilS, partial [Actinobacteria bacterium]|nr:tRNA lysidine(34) synthetase TilS [Actinomycetota bacterium]
MECPRPGLARARLASDPRGDRQSGVVAGAHRLKSSDEVLAAVADAFSHEGRVAIALSGGGDSAVAAWAITQLAGPDRVRAIHVHHGLASSDDMAGAADAVAAHVGIGLTRLDVVVPDGASFEGKARDVRLAAIENALDDDEIVVTGHHAGDVAETVIGNLLRGAGATGLGGIASRRGVWHRPLVGVPAALVADAAAELGIPFVDDPENTDLRHTRNVIRHRVLPLVEEFAGSAVERVIGRSADALRADDTELERLLEGFTVGESAGAAVAGAALLATLPGPLAARAARRLLREAHPPYPGSSDDVASLLSVARGDTHRVSLSGGYVASREGPHVAVYIDAPAPSDPTRLEPGGSARFGAWVLSLVAVGG